MNNYEECLTTDNDSSFLYDFIKMMFVCGIGSIIASFFVSNHVWRPMIMSQEEIKEAELELEEENKDVPYEERYPLSDESEYADYEDISGSSGISSEGEEQIKAFLKNFKNFSLFNCFSPIESFGIVNNELPYFFTTPDLSSEQGGIDGFFIACLKKNY